MTESIIKTRRHWSEAEKIKVVKLTLQPGATVSAVARKAEIAISQLFAWKRIYKNQDLNSFNEEKNDNLEIRLLEAELKIMRLERNVSIINLELQKISESDANKTYFGKKNWFTEK